MPRMGKTEEDWDGLKLGFLKTVQPNSFSKLISAVCNFKNNAQETFVCLESLILSFPCNFFVYFKFHSDWGRVIWKIKQNELDCRDTAPLTRRSHCHSDQVWQGNQGGIEPVYSWFSCFRRRRGCPSSLKALPKKFLKCSLCTDPPPPSPPLSKNTGY